MTTSKPRSDLSDLQSLQESERPCPVLDVRSPKEFHKGHLPGARNLPLQCPQGPRVDVGAVRVITYGTTVQPYLVGGLEHGFYDFPYIGKNHPN